MFHCILAACWLRDQKKDISYNKLSFNTCVFLLMFSQNALRWIWK